MMMILSRLLREREREILSSILPFYIYLAHHKQQTTRVYFYRQLPSMAAADGFPKRIANQKLASEKKMKKVKQISLSLAKLKQKHYGSLVAS